MFERITIDDNCIIGAGSVVTKSFKKPNMVIAGNPAREISTTEELCDKNKKYALNVWKMSSSEKKEYILNHEEQFK